MLQSHSERLKAFMPQVDDYFYWGSIWDYSEVTVDW